MALWASVIFSSGTASRRPAVRARRIAICSGADTGAKFRLFQAGADPLAVIDGLAGVFVDVGAEAGKRLKFLELRIGELEIARDRA